MTIELEGVDNFQNDDEVYVHIFAGVRHQTSAIWSFRPTKPFMLTNLFHHPNRYVRAL